MLPSNRPSTHPGEILWEEFLLPEYDGDISKLCKAMSVKYDTTEDFWRALVDYADR
jgi:plasmid maintenance system antidote protein VapI